MYSYNCLFLFYEIKSNGQSYETRHCHLLLVKLREDNYKVVCLPYLDNFRTSCPQNVGEELLVKSRISNGNERIILCGPNNIDLKFSILFRRMDIAGKYCGSRYNDRNIHKNDLQLVQ